MDFVNIHSRTLKTDAYVRATGNQRATWLNLLTYCTMQENSGKIPRAAGWTDLQWLVAVGIHKADAEEACDLWRFTPEGDCVVEFYPLEQERKHQAQREGGYYSSEKTAPGQNNIHAKPFRLRDKNGRQWVGRGIAQFIRSHPELFTEDELKLNKKGRPRALYGLNKLRPKIRVSKQPTTWHGWTWVSITERRWNDGNDLLDRDKSREGENTVKP